MRTPRSSTVLGKLLLACGVAAWASAGCGPPPVVEAPATEASADQASRPGQHHRGHGHHRDGDGGPGDVRGGGGVEDEPGRAHAGGEREAPAAEVPGRVAKILQHIDEYQRPPDGYEGGRTFHNAGRDGEQALPRTDADGRPVTYREWDVHPHVPGVNRGAERLVTGSDGSAYYTADHYRTFTKVR